jgi:hypothetical protein
MGEACGEGEMNINLHIERLVLDGIPLGPGQRPLLQTAVEAELTRLLSKGGLNNALQSGGALYNVRTAGIQLADDRIPARLGQQIAGAVYRGIGK